MDLLESVSSQIGAVDVRYLGHNGQSIFKDIRDFHADVTAYYGSSSNKVLELLDKRIGKLEDILAKSWTEVANL